VASAARGRRRRCRSHPQQLCRDTTRSAPDPRTARARPRDQAGLCRGRSGSHRRPTPATSGGAVAGRLGLLEPPAGACARVPPQPPAPPHAPCTQDHSPTCQRLCRAPYPSVGLSRVSLSLSPFSVSLCVCASAWDTAAAAGAFAVAGGRQGPAGSRAAALAQPSAGRGIARAARLPRYPRRSGTSV
jgi:hypothetical protein